MNKCSDCEFGRWASALNGYTCKHEKGLAILHKGKTSPHKCPLKESKYIQHGNRNSGIMDMRNYMARGYHK